MPPAPRPASRIRQTHDAAPQEPCGPATRIHPRPFIRHTAPRFSHCTDTRCGAAEAARASNPHPQPSIRHTAPRFSHCTDARCGLSGDARPQPTDVNRSKARPQKPVETCRETDYAKPLPQKTSRIPRTQSATAKPDTSDADSSNHRPGKQAAAPYKKTSVPENPAPMRACFQIVIPRLPRRARPAKQAVT